MTRIVAPRSVISEIAIDKLSHTPTANNLACTCVIEPRDISSMQATTSRPNFSWRGGNGFPMLLVLFFVVEFAQFFRKYRKLIAASRQMDGSEAPNDPVCKLKKKEQSDKVMNSLLHKVSVNASG